MLKQFQIIVFFLISQITFPQNIKIHYLGHSAFVLRFDNILVVTDYGKPNAWEEWGWNSPICDFGEIIPDIMTYSHLHEDHYDSTRIPAGVKYILRNGGNLALDELKITSIPSCEDKFGDFNNSSYLFSYKGFNILHTGDIQTMIANIENDTIANYFKKKYPEKIDLLIMPIEGKIKYISAAEKFIRFFRPGIVIPCHFWSKEYLDQFVSYLENYKNDYDINTLAQDENLISIIQKQNNKTLILIPTIQ